MKVEDICFDVGSLVVVYKIDCVVLIVYIF